MELSLFEKQTLFVELVSKLISFCYSQGFQLTFGDAWASIGHKKNSNHYIRLAIDLNLFKDSNYLARTEDHLFLGLYWESLHPLCYWGGRFNDGNHYSLKHQERK
jgi:hypothetical protein